MSKHPGPGQAAAIQPEFRLADPGFDYELAEGAAVAMALAR